MSSHPRTDTADRFVMEPPGTRLLDVPLVTGADSGFGQAIAYQLAAHGAAVAINHLGDSKVADKMVGAIQNVGGKAIALPMDVTQEEQVRRAFAHTADTFDDVAGVVAFLASERADYIVGSTVFVDGGMTLYPRFE